MPTTRASPSSSLRGDELEAFQRDGLVVLRGFLSEQQLAAISRPVEELQSAPGSPLLDLDAGTTKFNFPDFQGLRQRPDLASASCDNPRLLAAIERALGEEAELSQFGALTWKPGAPGVHLHYDYRPYRVVGSFLDWMFCIIPLTDYRDEDGPLLLRPRSHRLTSVLDNDEPGIVGSRRVHQVQAAQVPPFEDVEH